MEYLRQWIRKVGAFLTSGSIFRQLALLALILFILLMAVSLFLFNDVLVFLSIFFWLASSFSDSGVADKWLTWIFALLTAIPLVAGIKCALSFKWKKRRAGYVILCSWFLAYCGLMYQMNREIVFPPEGKCYTVTLDGEIEFVPCEWKIDPRYGTPVKPVTPEIAYTMAAKNKGYPTVPPVRLGKDARYFAPDGTPLYCYYERDDGMIELFKMPCGAHPQFGGEAQTRPVNAQIVKKYREQMKQKEAAPFLPDSDSAEIEAEGSALEHLKTSLESVKVKRR